MKHKRYIEQVKVANEHVVPKFGIYPSIEIKAPPGRVFSYLADLARHHEWSGEPKLLPIPNKGGPSQYQMTQIVKQAIPGFGGWYGGYGGPAEVPRVRTVTASVIRTIPDREITIHYEPWNLDRIFTIDFREGCTVLRLCRKDWAGFWIRYFRPYLRMFRSEERTFLWRIKGRLELANGG